jgi:uncharacterized RDD family membrane protein YckC
MDNEYYILQSGERVGPFTLRDLLKRPLEPSDLVLLPSQSKATPAYDIPEFDDYFHSEGIYYPTQQNTSSYWLRLPAFIIDCFVVGIAIWLPGSIFLSRFLPGLQNGGDPVSYQKLMEQAQNLAAQHATMVIAINFAVFFITVLYHAGCESSQLKASVGKYAMGLAVVDELGYSLTFKQALMRNLGKIIYQLASMVISLLAYVAYLRMIWTDRHQTFHDMFSGCYVVKKSV